MPTSLAGLALVADVDLAGGVFADQHRGQARDDGRALRELIDFSGDLRLDRRGERLAVKNDRGHREEGSGVGGQGSGRRREGIVAV